MQPCQLRGPKRLTRRWTEDRISIGETTERESSNCLNALLLNHRQQTQCWAARFFYTTLPVGNQVFTDIQIECKHRLRKMLTFTQSTNALRRHRQDWC